MSEAVASKEEHLIYNASFKKAATVGAENSVAFGFIGAVCGGALTAIFGGAVDVGSAAVTGYALGGLAGCLLTVPYSVKQSISSSVFAPAVGSGLVILAGVGIGSTFFSDSTSEKSLTSTTQALKGDCNVLVETGISVNKLSTIEYTFSLPNGCELSSPAP